MDIVRNCLSMIYQKEDSLYITKIFIVYVIIIQQKQNIIAMELKCS